MGKRREAENQMRASSAFSGVAQWISNLLYQGCQKGRIPFSTYTTPLLRTLSPSVKWA